MAREGPGSRATEADVLYLEEDAPPTATDFGESDGRHHVRFDAEGGLTGSASVVVHGDLEAGRRSAVTGPEPVEVGEIELRHPCPGRLNPPSELASPQWCRRADPCSTPTLVLRTELALTG